MFPVPLVTSSEECFTFSAPLFWDIVQLYHNRPFLANKLVTAVTKVIFYKIYCKGSFTHISELFTSSAILYERRKLKELSKESITVDFIKRLIEAYDKNATLSVSNEEEFNSDFSNTFISIQLLISKKNTDHKVLEVVVLDRANSSAIFIGAYEEKEDLLTPKFPYEFQLSGNTLKINLQNFEDADSPQAEWLANALFPKLLKWSEYKPDKKNINTLSLVPIDEYSIIYNGLKKTYVKGLIKDWLEITNTDPQKYIFEDLAIASYLICLWKKFPKQEISFVDCGCGNGLLVYILNQEGFQGYGIDIRKRSIWNIYPTETRLEVGAVTPDSIFPNSTWLIGNHSDELTPWIPVMAAKSSPKTNFFVLPCCPFDFNGEKYIRKDSSVSTYSDYLNYIKFICDKCHFKTELDKLRIPSTKKVCIVGIRTSSEEELQSAVKDIQYFIANKMVTEFKARSAVETVRNCTQLNRKLTDKLVSTCVNFLLEKEQFIEKLDGQLWNKGSVIPIPEIIKTIPRDDLKQLSNQCGGLQTLFRNFRYIFEVKNGCVSIRQPTTCEVTKGKYKNKPCWFHKNHPNGCFNKIEDCSYFHDE